MGISRQSRGVFANSPSWTLIAISSHFSKLLSNNTFRADRWSSWPRRPRNKLRARRRGMGAVPGRSTRSLGITGDVVRIAIGIVALCVSISAAAREDDFVRVKYFVDYPRMDRNSQITEVEVTRRSGAPPPGQPPI